MANKERKTKGVKRIGEVLPQLMARRGYADFQRTTALQQAWNAVAGTVFSRHSRAARIRRGVVEVVVRNSAMLQELTFRKTTLVQGLADRLTSEKVSDMKFRIGRME